MGSVGSVGSDYDIIQDSGIPLVGSRWDQWDPMMKSLKKVDLDMSNFAPILPECAICDNTAMADSECSTLDKWPVSLCTTCMVGCCIGGASRVKAIAWASYRAGRAAVMGEWTPDDEALDEAGR